MSLPIVVAIVGTALAVLAGVTFTWRGFRANARAIDAENGAPHPPERVPISPHDRAVTEQLKRFFDGKTCAICNQPIAPVQRTGQKPGLWNPTTHATYSWEEIPDANLAAVLETHQPLCPACQVAESFRERFPDRVVDRERAAQDARLA